MAVSHLQQRLMPLTEATLVWRPWGPFMSKPDSDSENEMTMEPRRSRRRCQTWSDYIPYAFQEKAASGKDVEGAEISQKHPKKYDDYSDDDCDVETTDGKEEDAPEAFSERPSMERPSWSPSYTYEPLPDTLPWSKRPISGRPCWAEEPESPAERLAWGSPAEDRNNGMGHARNSWTAARTSDQDTDSSKQDFGDMEAHGVADTVVSQRTGTGELVRAGMFANGVTTVMLRNMPLARTQKELIDELDESGFRDAYDFCYLPHNFKTTRNRGYAFINFYDPGTASYFAKAWQKSRRLSISTRDKPLDVSVAAVQGRDANFRKALSQKMGRIKNTDFRPFVIMPDDAAEPSD